MRIKKLPVIGIISAILIAISGCSEKKSVQSFFAMNTYMTFTIYGTESEELSGSLQKEIYKLERLWSVTDENSDVYKINNSEGRTVLVDEKTAQLIDFSLIMSEKTGGAFNPTIYPVLKAWGFTTGNNRIPTAEEISETLSRTGCGKIKTDGNSVTAEKGTMVDFGGAAKGYAGDIAVDYLKNKGVTSALLDIGGNIQAIGTKPDGSSWKIGLRSPFSDGIAGTIEITDKAVVTSGNYERFFIGEDGKKYGHIINPVTGYPVENDLASVTIIGKEGKVCDALSTALFVMGYEGAVDFYKETGGFDMILITEDEEIHITEGIADSFSTDGKDIFIIE